MEFFRQFLLCYLNLALYFYQNTCSKIPFQAVDGVYKGVPEGEKCSTQCSEHYVEYWARHQVWEWGGGPVKEAACVCGDTGRPKRCELHELVTCMPYVCSSHTPFMHFQKGYDDGKYKTKDLIRNMVFRKS